MDALTLPVSEVFGPVWQGEGPHAGRLCSFVRLGHCNLTCEWCDTPFTWDAERFDLSFSDLTPDEIIDGKIHTELVILSGGEPMMHQRRQAFQAMIGDRAHEWHIETNGTIVPLPETIAHVAHFAVSPKINTRDPEKKRLKSDALAVFAGLAGKRRAIFKFVAKAPHDVDFAAFLTRELGVPPEAVWIMPEGVEADALLQRARELADTVLAYGFNLTLRQQVLMYGTERAR